MNTVEIEVKKCNKCPFSQVEWGQDDNDKTQATCYAPVEIHKRNYDINNYYHINKSPKWCPLKKNNLSIKFKTK